MSSLTFVKMLLLNDGNQNMNVYRNMTAETLEAEYNLPSTRFEVVQKRWIKKSEAQLKISEATLDIPYGSGEREKLDYYFSGDSDGPLLLYIHGGYWQRGDKKLYSFITKAFLEHGVSVAIMNYNLTPSVRLGQISHQIKKAISWCYKNSDELKFSKDKITVSGHSAGGHLTAMMMATNWPDYDQQLPINLIKHGLLISGIFELEPLVHTTINAGPQMDIPEAITESPIFIPPVTNAPLLLVYGGGESSEFHRQSNDYAAKFQTTDRKIEVYETPDVDHFDELDCLADKDTVFFQKSLQLINS